MKERIELIQAILACRAKTKEIKVKPPKGGKEIVRRVPYSWRDVAAELYPGQNKNVMGALLNKIYNHPEYEPGQDVCERLGLIYKIPTPVCRTHGIVHCYDCESQVVKTKPKPRKSRPRPAYKQLYQNTAILLLAILSQDGRHD